MIESSDQFRAFIDVSVDEEKLTDEKRKLIKMLRSLPHEERDPLIRVAEYLAAHPSNGKMSQAEFDALCESAKRLQ